MDSGLDASHRPGMTVGKTLHHAASFKRAELSSLTPSPLWGRGGEGVGKSSVLGAYPSPWPSPTRGEGTIEIAVASASNHAQTHWQDQRASRSLLQARRAEPSHSLPPCGGGAGRGVGYEHRAIGTPTPDPSPQGGGERRRRKP